MKRANCGGATVVLLHQPSDKANSVYDMTPTPSSLSMLPSIPGVDRSRLPTFLYMWQPEPDLGVE